MALLKNLTILFVLPALLFCTSQSKGQEVVKPQAKNVIYSNVGSLGLWFTASLNFEYQLFSTDNRINANYYMRACGGAFATWGAEGPYGSVSLQAVYGKRNSHLEIGLGVAALYDKGSYKIGVSNANYPYPGYEPEPTRWDYTDVTPAATIGYRFQKPDGGFVFRAGAGFPDGVYLSFGMAF